MAKKPDEVAVIEENKALVAVNDDVDDAMLAEFAGQGNENLRQEDVAIPRLLLLQDLSPQVKRTEAAYVEGAMAGLFFNSLTQEIYGEDVEVIDCHYISELAEWVPRKKGGGFRGAYPIDDPILQTAKADQENGGRLVLPNGNDLVPTSQHFLLVKSKITGTWETCLFAAVSTTRKHSRRLNALLSQRMLLDKNKQPLKDGKGAPLYAPRFASVVRFSVGAERNDQGSWFVPKFEVVRSINSSELTMAKAFRDLIARGEVKVNLGDDVGGTPGAAEATQQPKTSPVIDDEIPF